MVKGLNALLVFLKLYTATSGTYTMLNGIGDAIFYFMPVILGYTALKIPVASNGRDRDWRSFMLPNDSRKCITNGL